MSSHAEQVSYGVARKAIWPRIRAGQGRPKLAPVIALVCSTGTPKRQDYNINSSNIQSADLPLDECLCERGICPYQVGDPPCHSVFSRLWIKSAPESLPKCAGGREV